MIGKSLEANVHGCFLVRRARQTKYGCRLFQSVAHTLKLIRFSTVIAECFFASPMKGLLTPFGERRNLFLAFS